MDSERDREILEFVSSVTDEASRRVEENLPHGYARLKLAEAERRQALYDIKNVEDAVRELVRNSRDAGSRLVLVGSQKEENRYRNLLVIDDGHGVPTELHRMIFEPRVTSRLDDLSEDDYGIHGRGMALFSIKSQADDARVIWSEPGRGTIIAVRIDNRKVPERADQSSVTPLIMTGEKNVPGRGPHNIFRVLLEMSLAAPEMELYLGSYAEVLSTIRVLDSRVRNTFWSGVSDVQDAGHLVRLAREWMDTDISERTAYRILCDEVKPLSTIMETAPRIHTGEELIDESGDVAIRKPTARVKKPRYWMREQNLARRFSTEEIKEVCRETQEAIDRIGEKYFLRCMDSPRLKRGGQKLSFTIHLEEIDEE